ncbi:GNAT family N-acetyltransferase [Actinomycetospora corticicola]|uniref:Putative N-acetyltransferase (TIGR04045 family) n=1 Tax=Actinomycetospora corticicola TaxID=663602 RepID=A0A7Y9J9J6_9PSEU|nr:MSMEG_0567/sll0787 family protein [Actinomycetospora corticicola]NYD39474.1 putative N-acetyltransferase (TIGR04045 family) [Actinomycetospora corticicola]
MAPPFDDVAVLPPGDSADALLARSAQARTLVLAEEILGGLVHKPRGVTVSEAPAADATHPDVIAHRALRRAVFVDEQRVFAHDDLDDVDSDPRAIVLVARDADGTVLGGVRLGPARPGEPDLGWWTGSRLAVEAGGRRRTGVRVGATLIRAAVARAESAGVLRFEADVQAPNARLFERLGWETVAPSRTVGGIDHVRMRRPMDRIARLVDATKAPLGDLVAGMAPPGFVGDDGAPVPGTDVVAACDAILPALVERDPEWAGWCSVLVNLNDLAAMGARPVGLLDAVGGADAEAVGRVLRGLRAAAAAYGVPVLGGHTTVDVPASLAVTALGTTARPVPAGGGRVGHAVRLTADLDGAWRPGYTGRQFDTTSRRRPEDLRAMVAAIGPDAAYRPAAAKDVSMAGLVGTLGMLAEASGTGAVLDVAAVPRPDGVGVADWFTCFPGFALLSTDEPGAPLPAAGPAVGTECGELVAGRGVALRWPDGETTTAVAGPVTGLGTATERTDR